MHVRTNRIAALALAALLLAPSLAAACPIPIRTIGPIKVSAADLRRPILRESTRASWKFDSSWTSVAPRLSQFVKLKGVGRAHAVSFAKQQFISIDARGPEDHGWQYFDDDDPATPSCQLAGKVEWQHPKIRVIETKTEVRIAAASQRVVGDRVGCTYGFEQGTQECPNLTRVILKLKQPIGPRKLYFERFDLPVATTPVEPPEEG
ncbi:MAG: hypothetical protein JWM90_2048 [Thermoleophilia bacterium]|nr:hypothetical protein [Thermoleophilia bacterium]